MERCVALARDRQPIMQLRHIPNPNKATKEEIDVWVEQNILGPRREALAKARARAKARRAEHAADLAALAKAGIKLR